MGGQGLKVLQRAGAGRGAGTLTVELHHGAERPQLLVDVDHCEGAVVRVHHAASVARGCRGEPARLWTAGSLCPPTRERGGAQAGRRAQGRRAMGRVPSKEEIGGHLPGTRKCPWAPTLRYSASRLVAADRPGGARPLLSAPPTGPRAPSPACSPRTPSLGPAEDFPPRP